MSGWNQSVNTFWMEPLGWSVLHSLWQISAITLLYALVLAITKRLPSARRASLRYVAGCVALATMVLVPAITFGLLLSSDRDVAAIPSPISHPAQHSLSVEPRPQLHRLQPNAPTTKPGSIAISETSASAMTLLDWLAVAWVVGVLCAAIRPLIGIRRVRQLRRDVCELPELQSIVDQLVVRIGIRRAVSCVGTTLSEVPLIVGHLRPIILMPLSLATGLDGQQLECLLAHELAHVRRHDYLVNLLQVAIETLLFFHPLTWWVSHRVRADREFCADDMAMAVTGERKRYAEALLELEKCRHYSVPAVAASGGSLLNRVQRLTLPNALPETVGLSAEASKTRRIIACQIVFALLLPIAYRYANRTDTYAREHVMNAKDLSDNSADESSHARFWEAVKSGDIESARELLAKDAALANRDFRPVEKQDAHTDGFPLVRACQDGNYELAKLLLEHGADVDSRSPTEEQREFGKPLFISVYDEQDKKPRYDLANLLLDHGASVKAYPFSHEPMVYWLYGAAMRAAPDVVPGMVHRGVQKHLPDRQRDYPSLPADAHEAVKLFDRVLSLDAELPLNSLLKHEHYELIEEMLRHDPKACFEELNGPANWYGYPVVWDLIMEICPQLHNFETAKSAINAATVSHNRDGSYTDYCRLIEMQLNYLQEQGQLEALRGGESPFKAHHELASHFCWPSNYGYKAGVSKPEHLLDLAKLYISYGFKDINYRDPKTNRTPLATAIARGHHPGMLQYAEFLIQQGADLCLDDPEDMNPLALAKKFDATKHGDLRAALVNLLSDEDQPADVYTIEQLCNACRKGDFAAVRKIIAVQPELVDADDQHQWRPVFHAALRQHESIVQLLIEEGADLAAHDGYALHYAAEVPDNQAIVKLLVEHGALEAHTRPADNLSRQLLHAVYLSDATRVAKLLKRHPRLAVTVDGLGDQPMHHAARNGETEIVRLLLEHNADVNARNERGHTVLYCAGGHGHVDTVKLLLDHGADKEVAFTHDGKTLLQWLEQYPDEERLQKVTPLLREEPDGDKQGSFSYEGIFQAVKEGDADRVLAMIDDDNTLLNVADHNQSTPLTRAFVYHNLELAEKLIERGGNVFAMNHSDKWPMRSIVEKGGLPHAQRSRLAKAAITAGACKAEIFHAVWRGDHDGVKTILKQSPAAASVRHADPNGKNGFYNRLPYCGLTPLHYAVIAGDKSMVDLLLKAGAEVDAVPHAHKPGSRHTPMYFVPEGCGDVAQLLIDHGADVNHTAQYLSEGSQSMREVIIAAGAGGTPLMRALVLGELDKAAQIIRDDPAVINDRLPNSPINTPLHMAVKAGSTEIIALLLDQGMDVDTLSSRGRTPLALAPEVYCSLDMFQLLVERGADIHFNNDFPLKATVWQHAYGHENYESVIRFLVKKGSHPRGLCDCVRGGNLVATKMLLELGADVNETDRDGQTPLDYATGTSGSHERPEIAKLLREHGGKHSKAM